MNTNDVHGDIAKALMEGSNWMTAGLKDFWEGRG